MEKLVTKRELEELGINPEFITYQAKAIIKEMEKEYPDWGYIKEKAKNIISQLETIKKVMG